MKYYGKTKDTDIEKTIAQLSSGEAMGGAMYYALAKIAKEQFGLEDVAKDFIELGNQETNHGAFYALLNGRYPIEEKLFWQMVKGLSKAEYKGEESLNKLAQNLNDSGLSEAAEQVKEFAVQEKHHGEVTEKYYKKYGIKFEESLEKQKYVCTVCGFEYDGDINKEPDNYKCPLCNMPKSAFKKEE